MLDLAIVWHLHQPPYQDPQTGEIVLPWVRLHAAKDYLDMVLLLDEFPNLKLNFNLTPCLIEQIIEYSPKTDRFAQLTRKHASELTDEEKITILQYFFSVPIATMIKPYPRYFELLEKRGINFDPTNSTVLSKFLPEDFRDLQVLANLVWIDPLFRNQPPISELFAKRRKYTEADKQTVLKFMQEILNQVIIQYRKAFQAGQVELLTSPFYHPILPLLCDAQSASLANPKGRPPDWDFRFPEDAQAQLEKGMAFFERNFGHRPQGVWLPESAISQEAINVLASAGVKWTIGDEKVLAKSLGITWHRDNDGILLNGKLLYTPYLMNFDHRSIILLFRDAYLSDLIGFEYGTWDSIVAAEDFYQRIKRINTQLPKEENYLLVIALDGENPWENYKNDGLDFLRHFYSLLNSSADIKTVKISDYLATQKDLPELKVLAPGSWVNGNFDIWAGSEADAQAWKLLAKTRKDLVDYEKKLGKRIDEAWEEIYQAEASDWFWWFGEEYYSAFSPIFDWLFRSHLLQVYRIIGKVNPGELDKPIQKIIRNFALPPKNYIKPIIDGKETNFYEWQDAGYFDLTSPLGAMDKGFNRTIEKLWYGFDETNLYLRIDVKNKTRQLKIEFLNLPGAIFISEKEAYYTYEDKKFDLRVAYEQFYELQIPKTLFNPLTSSIQLVVKSLKNEAELACSSVLTIEIPDERTKARFWQA
jgi:alpha-amylase/alpha-mannosidase (GH57 family)